MTYKDKLKKKIRESGVVTNVQRNEYERNVDKIVDIVINELQNFSAFLNNYPNFEDVRFDWMLLDYFDGRNEFKIKQHN